MSVEITWYGQATTTITYDEKVLLVDPWFEGNPLSPIKPEDLEHVDIVAITHGHFDHFGDCLEICKRFDAKLISTPEIAWYADGKGIPRGTQALPLGYGGELTVGAFTLAMVPAVHPTALYGEEWVTQKKYIPDGGPASYIISAENKVIFHAGDTALFSDMKLIADRYQPELGLLPIGGRFTMDTTDAATAVQLLGLNNVIPIHYNTFPDLSAEPKDLVDNLKSQKIDAEVIILNPGESFVWE